MVDLSKLSLREQHQGFLELRDSPFFQAVMEACQHERQQCLSLLLDNPRVEVDGMAQLVLQQQQIGEVRTLLRPLELLNLVIQDLERKVKEQENG